MKRVVLYTGFFLLLTLFLTGCRFPLPGKRVGALKVDSSPQATVFINGERRGETPFSDEKLKPGTYTLKLVPASPDLVLAPWEGEVKITAGTLTAVKRELGPTPDQSSGEVLFLEPLSDKKAVALNITTIPDSAVVTVDGEPQGFAPLRLDNIAEGDHQITVSLPGYQERKVQAKTLAGHQLNLIVQLALLAEETPSEEEATSSAEATPSAETTPTPSLTPQPTSTASPSAELERPYVVINSPEIGWVRVRAKPTTSSEELLKVNHGEKYKLLEVNEVGWYKIEYQPGKTGWISGRYAERYD